MARLPQGEYEERKNRLLRLLKRLCWGVRESEIAGELGWERRTVNNYLQKLRDENKAWREGRSWFAE
jgi:DNA-binding transcriptional regulator LsrR (DeoR family)